MVGLRPVLLIGAALALQACTPPIEDCLSVGAFQAGGDTDVANLDRICQPALRRVRPVMIQPGNVWPPAPPPVPTMLDMQRQVSSVDRFDPLQPSARQHRGGNGLCRPSPAASAQRQKAPAGFALGLCYAPSPE